jgi:hypothetical protein
MGERGSSVCGDGKGTLVSGCDTREDETKERGQKSPGKTRVGKSWLANGDAAMHVENQDEGCKTKEEIEGGQSRAEQSGDKSRVMSQGVT